MPDGQGSESKEYASLPNPEAAVAVIGLACRFPGSDSLDEFWEVLESGSSMHQELPKDRFPDARFSRRGHFKQFRGNLMNNVADPKRRFDSCKDRGNMSLTLVSPSLPERSSHDDVARQINSYISIQQARFANDQALISAKMALIQQRDSQSS